MSFKFVREVISPEELVKEFPVSERDALCKKKEINKSKM